jgi:hypothetical protein
VSPTKTGRYGRLDQVSLGGGAVEPKSADQSIDGTAPLDGLGQFVKR